MATGQPGQEPAGAPSDNSRPVSVTAPPPKIWGLGNCRRRKVWCLSGTTRDGLAWETDDFKAAGYDDALEDAIDYIESQLEDDRLHELESKVLDAADREVLEKLAAEEERRQLKAMANERDHAEGKKFVAYITVFPGTGRPDRPVVRATQLEDVEDLYDIDPMAWHNGARLIGVYDSLDEAEDAVYTAWEEEVVTDDRGYVQWA